MEQAVKHYLDQYDVEIVQLYTDLKRKFDNVFQEKKGKVYK